MALAGRSFLLLAPWARARRLSRCWRPRSAGPSDVASERCRRRAAPHTPACSLRFALGTLQFLDSTQRQPRADPCETVADQHGVHELAVFRVHVRQVPIVGVECRTILLESHPSMEEQRGETIASLAPKRCIGLEPAAEFRRVDAEQAHSPDGGNVNGVAVDDGSDQHWVGSPGDGRRQRSVQNDSGDEDESDQVLHGQAPVPRHVAGRHPWVQAKDQHRWLLPELRWQPRGRKVPSFGGSPTASMREVLQIQRSGIPPPRS